MTLPTSGPLTLADIQTEFGGSNPISLSEYYAGGSYVPAGTTGTNGAVPSSGTISISNFYGTSNVVIQLTSPVTVAYASGNLTAAVAGYAIDPDGYVYTAAAATATYSQFEQWDNVAATTGNYQVRATLNSGDTPSGTLGTWTTITARQTWQLISTRPGGGQYKTCNLTIEIRDTATSTVRATATVTLEADST